jgi:hypothetical protein
MLSVSTAGCCPQDCQSRDQRGCAKKQKGSRPASWVPAEEQRSSTESKVESLKDWLIRPNGKVH